jgi:hypothetical protein
MDRVPDAIQAAPRSLRDELDRSRDDLAAGRVRPLSAILTAIHGRATRQIERRELARQAEGQRLAEPS